MTAKLIIVLTIVSPLLLLAIISSVHGQPQHQQYHNLQPTNQEPYSPLSSPQRRVKRMYAVCPPEFQRIGNECYYFSKQKETWMEAYWNCRERVSKLAEPFKFEDKRLRKYLTANSGHIARSIKWIGGRYNWESHSWHWGQSGRNMTYKAFSQMQPGGSQDLKHHCAVLNPDLEYRWSSRDCMQQHHFVCQHRMPYVNKRQLDKVYARWNVTYPNQFANQMEVIVRNPNNKRHIQLMRSRYERKNQIKNRQSNSVAVAPPVEKSDAKETRVSRKKNTLVHPDAPFRYGGGVVRPVRRWRKRPTTTTTIQPVTGGNELPEDDLVEVRRTMTTTPLPITTTLSTTTTTEKPTPITTEVVNIPMEHHLTRHHNHHHHKHEHEMPEHTRQHPERHRHHHEEASRMHEITNEIEPPPIPEWTTSTTTTTTTTPAPTTTTTTTTTTSPPPPPPTTVENVTDPPLKPTTEAAPAKHSNDVHEKTSAEKLEEKRKRIEAIKEKFSKMSKKQKELFLKINNKLHKKLSEGN